MMRAACHILRRDLRLSAARGADAVVTVFFFVVVASLFPFMLGGDMDLLSRASAGIVWIAAVLAALLSLDAVYHRDYDDGTFALLLMSPVPPVVLAAVKMLSHWLLSGLLLLPAAAVVSVMLAVPAEMLCGLLLSLALGSVYLSLLGGFAACVTFGSRRPGVLLAVLVLPLFVPMLVLGALAAGALLAGLPAKPYLLLQAALVLAALPLAPLAAGAMLSMNARS